MFSMLHSKWQIKYVNKNECKVDYFLSMTMHNPLYMMITKRFFDLLANTMHSSFSERCKEKYYSETDVDYQEGNANDQKM